MISLMSMEGNITYTSAGNLKMGWFVGLRNPVDIYKTHSSYLACELVFYLMALLTFIHAYRHGGRLKYLWLATILHGLTVESVSYFLPDIDNFWHAQSMVMFLGRRLPLHIVLFCFDGMAIFPAITPTSVQTHALSMQDPAFIYTASVSVFKMRLRWWAEPFAVGLAVVLLDVPFDIMGIKLLWWTWHDTDPNIYDRHYWVPWTSYYFHATFASGFTIIFNGSHKLLTNAGKLQSAGLSREVICCVLTGLLSMPLGVLQFLPIYHPLHDMYKIHTEPCVLLLISIYTLIVWHSDRRPSSQARIGSAGVDELTIVTFLHFTTYILLVLLSSPELIRSEGLHQTVGECAIEEPVYTAFGQVLSKKKYLCLTDYEENYFDFHCVNSATPSDAQWYSICGNVFPNHLEYIIVVSIFSLCGLLFYLQANIFSGKIPLVNVYVKTKVG